MPPIDRSPRRFTPVLALTVMLGLMTPRSSGAQTTNDFVACSQGTLLNCADIRLSTVLNAAPGGLNLFRIALSNLGSIASPTLATSLYYLVLNTGEAAAPSDQQVDHSVTPVESGGASVVDPTPWDIFDGGDAIFLSALSNNGVGGCVSGSAVSGFGQMGQTCGSSQSIVFDFFTSHVYDPGRFTLSDAEFVGLSGDLPADSCNDATPCRISAPVTATPEPATIGLVMTGFASVAGAGWRRRRRGGTA